MTDALVPTVDVAALERMPLDEQIDALAEAWRGWRRLEVEAAWTFGRALRSIRGRYQRGEWGGVLDRIGIHPETARRYMRLADGDNPQIVGYLTVDEGLKVLGPRHPQPEPKATPTPNLDYARGADFGGDTGATVWYKRSAHNVLATTEAPA